MKRLAKVAASALFAASVLTFGAADPVLDTVPVAQAAAKKCSLPEYLEMIWNGEVEYSITWLEYGTAYGPRKVDSSIYVNAMLSGTKFNQVKGWKIPEGQYVILEIPDYDVRYEFYYGDDGNYIREIIDGTAHAYHAKFSSKKSKACKIIEDWGYELSHAR